MWIIGGGGRRTAHLTCVKSVMITNKHEYYLYHLRQQENIQRRQVGHAHQILCQERAWVLSIRRGLQFPAAVNLVVYLASVWVVVRRR